MESTIQTANGTQTTTSASVEQEHAPAQRRQPAGARLAELAGVAALLAGLIGLQLWLTDSLYLFQRNFWADELHTEAIVSDPDFIHSMQALANCVDGAPPALHVSLRFFTRLTGGPAEVSHRLFALLSVLAALVGLFACLRHCFSPLTTFTAVLAIWSHPIILHQAFEARFYGPWLASIVWYAYFLARSRDATSRPLSNLGVAVTSVLVCTYHYFGIFTLVLVTGFELLFHRPSRATRWNGLAAATLGPIVLAACTPFYLGQRTGLTVATWAEEESLSTVIGFLYDVLLVPPTLVVVLLVAWLSSSLRMAKGNVDEAAPATHDLTALAGLTGLIGLPLVLVAFALLVQPALVDRYGMPAVAALAPAVALAAARMNRLWAGAMCILFLFVSAEALSEECDSYRTQDQGTRDLIVALQKLTGNDPVAFESIHELWVACRYAPRHLAERCFFLDFEPDEIGDADNCRILTRDLARRFAESYGAPGLIRWGEFQRLPRHYLVADMEFYKVRYTDPTQPYPGYVLHNVDDPLFELKQAVTDNKTPVENE